MNIKVAIRKKLESLQLSDEIKILDLKAYNQRMYQIWTEVNGKGGKKQ